MESFSMNGKALLMLQRDDFWERAPSVGDVMFNVLRHLASRSYSAQVRTVPIQRIHAPTVEWHLRNRTSPPRCVLPVSQENTAPVKPTVAPLSLGPIKQEMDTEMLQNEMKWSTPCDSPKSFCSESNKIPLKKRQLKSPTNSCPSSPMEDSCADDVTDGSGVHTNKDLSGNNKLLWEFISELLQEPNRELPVRWLDTTNYTFRITDPAMLADLWGGQKQKANMTYEKLSRALRYYYNMNIICKVQGKKLTYRFTTPPLQIKKGIRGAKPGVPHQKRNKDGIKPTKTNKKPTPADDQVLDLSVKKRTKAVLKVKKKKNASKKFSTPKSSTSSDSGVDIDPKCDDDIGSEDGGYLRSDTCTDPHHMPCGVSDSSGGCLDLSCPRKGPLQMPELLCTNYDYKHESPLLNVLHTDGHHSPVNLTTTAGKEPFHSLRSAFSIVKPNSMLTGNDIFFPKGCVSEYEHDEYAKYVFKVIPQS